MRKGNSKQTALFLILILLFVISCEDCPECPTCPDNELPPLENCRLYAFSNSHRFIVSVDIPADTIIDSIRVDYSGYEIFVTPDGKNILVMNYDDVTTEVYNGFDLTYSRTLNQFGSFYFDSGDNYGIWIAHRRGKVYFINITDLLPFDSINFSIGSAYLDTVNNLLFGVNLEADSIGGTVNDHLIYRIDCIKRELVDSIFVFDSDSIGMVNELAYNWLTNDLYFHAWMHFSPFFIQYDLDSDSIVNVTPTTYAVGSVSVSPDGTKVYMTDSGDGLYWIFPPGYLYVFDALTNQESDIIAPYVIPGGKIRFPLFGQIAITPDGRRAYLGSNPNAAADVPIIVVDLYEKKMIKEIMPFNTFWADRIAMGPVPDQDK